MAKKTPKTKRNAPEVVGQILLIDPKRIARFPEQPRKYFSKASIKSLADSIDTDGQHTSAIVTPCYDGRKDVDYYLVEGERRWRACSLNGRKLKAEVRTLEDARAHYELSAVANFNREGHTSLETADVIRTFKDEFGLDWQTISVKLGMTIVTLRKYYDLNFLHPEIQQRLQPTTPRNMRLSMGIASELSKLPEGEQLQVVAKIRGKRSDMATQIIRRQVEIAERNGLSVRRGGRGRKRRPSDEADIIQTRASRIAKDLEFILSYRPDALKVIFQGRGAKSNFHLLELLESISGDVSRVKRAIKAAMPDQVKSMVA